MGTVGEVNGLWARLFKVSLALIPFVLMWAAWVSTIVFDIRGEMLAAHSDYNSWIAGTESNQFTLQDWVRERRELVAATPSADRVQAIERRVTSLENGRNGG